MTHENKNISKDFENDNYVRMNNVLKTYRECTKRKIERLLEEEKIYFKNGKFFYKESGEEVENIKIKRKYLEEDDFEDEFDLSDESGSLKE